MPDMMIHFDLSRKKSIEAVEQALQGNNKIFLVTQMDTEEENPGYEEVYHVGTIAMVKQISKLPNGIVRVLVEGEKRGELLSFVEQEPFLIADVNEIEPCEEVDEVTNEAMIRHLAELFGSYSKYYPKIGHGLEKQFQVRKRGSC